MEGNKIRTIEISISLYEALSEEEKTNPNVVYWVEPDDVFNKYILGWNAGKSK